MATDFPEPYGQIFKGTGATINFAPAYHKIPEGVSMLTVTWDKPEALRITRAPIQEGASRVAIGEIPAGQGRRSIMIPGVGVDAGETTFISMQKLGGALATTNDRASLLVTTIPLKAAG